MKIYKNLLILLLVITFLTCEKKITEPVTTGSMTGKITDYKSGNALTNAMVTTIPETFSTQTGSDGTYILNDLPPDQYTIRVKRENYNDNYIIVDVFVGQETRADISLVEKQPELGISANILSFDSTQTEKILSITNKGIGEVKWIIENKIKWLTIDTTSGSTTTETDNVTLKAHTSGLTPGNYQETIKISSNGGNLTVIIQLIVANPNAQQLSVDKSDIKFGTKVVIQSLNIWNSGTGILKWTISKTQPWLSISQTMGYDNTKIAVIVDRQGIGEGTYSDKLTITSNGGIVQVYITMAVTAVSEIVNPVTLAEPTEITENSMKLQWTRNSDGNFESYIICRSLLDSVDVKSQKIIEINDRENTTFTDQGLAAGTSYYYSIFVKYKSQLVVGSNIVSGYTPITLGSWRVQGSADDGENNSYIQDIWMLNGNLGYLINSNCMVYFWNGSSWSKQIKLPVTKVYSINGSAANDVYIGTDYGLYRYDGSNWNMIPGTEMYSATYNSIKAFGNTNIWFIRFGKIANFDGTKVIKEFSSAKAIDKVYFTGVNSGMANGGDVFNWKGAYWMNVLTGKNITCMAFPKEDFCIAIGKDNSSNKTLWTYSRSGWKQNMNPQFPSKFAGVNTLVSARENVTWVSDSDGGLYFYNGINFREIAIPTKNISNFFMLNENDIWGIYGNTILRYTK